MTSQELEDKVRAYKDLSNQIAELEEKRKILGAEILEMLSKETKTFYIAGYRVQRCERLSIKISIDDARMLGVTKNEEVINKDEIKRLHQLGHSIPNVTMKESLIVYTLSKTSLD